ncbi:MAG: CobD/CbiB family protein, partial [Betaproteobacteria bacterium]|nr:CobD/CbiB family protein [Betaproteobacteria bacterium]
MKFLSLLAALLLEQVRPLRQGNRVNLSFNRYAAALERHFNAGQQRHGVIAWMLAVVPVLLAVAAVYHVLHALNPLLGWAWNVVVLYLTMGFRQFSHYYTEIQQALRDGNLAAARELLGRWRGESATEFGAGEIARVAIEQGLLASHRHVFGTVAWFLALGPAGALLYRASAMLAGKWSGSAGAGYGEFGRFAGRAYFWIDWLPARLTAASFAIVGNFEDAVYCWRTQAAAWATQAHGIILASGGGALGVRLGDPLHQHGDLQFRPELGTGDEADTGYMQGAAGILSELGISVETTVASAHRSPARVQRLVAEAPARGVRLFIVGAGAAAH